MTKIIIVDKNKNKKETNLRDFSLNNLFKKANLKNNKDFFKRNTWKNKDAYVSIFAKNSGRANNENSYELPPPIDSQLYFGKLIIVKHSEEDIKNDNVVDLTLEEWEKIYEKLFGGFEDLGEEDSYSEEEIIPEKYRTKEGYSKEDGFIVDDDEEEDEDYLPDDDEEEYNSEDDTSEPEDVIHEIHSNESEKDEDEDEDEKDEDEDEKDEDEEDEEDDLDSIGSELSESSYMSESDKE